MNNDQIEAVGGRFAKGLKWLGIALIVLGFLAIVFPVRRFLGRAKGS